MGNASASKHGAMGWADDNPGHEEPAKFIPTTEQVRDGFATDPIAEYNDPITNHTAQGRRVFDRWLAAHDAEVAAKTTKAIAEAIRHHCTPSADAYNRGGDYLILSVADWIEHPPEWVKASWVAAPVTAEEAPRG